MRSDRSLASPCSAVSAWLKFSLFLSFICFKRVQNIHWIKSIFASVFTSHARRVEKFLWNWLRPIISWFLKGVMNNQVLLGIVVVLSTVYIANGNHMKSIISRHELGKSAVILWSSDKSSLRLTSEKCMYIRIFWCKNNQQKWTYFVLLFLLL